jgi:hypothetical protein
MKFKVLYTSSTTDGSRERLESAHGGFAIDRRAGKGETYFACRVPESFRSAPISRRHACWRRRKTWKKTNLHNSPYLVCDRRYPILTFPANSANQVFTTTLDGKLVHTLNTPTSQDDFDQPAVNSYFKRQLYQLTSSNLDGLFTSRQDTQT